jgi:deoxyadenosine/deoxycytidine kinase
MEFLHGVVCAIVAPVVTKVISIAGEKKAAAASTKEDDRNIQPLAKPRTRPYVFSIEGNIGAGKSTLLEKLRKIIECGESPSVLSSPEEIGIMKLLQIHLEQLGLSHKDIVCMQEPVDVWESVKDSETGESILQKFYKDAKTYAFAFQVMAYTSRLTAFRRVVKENPNCKLILCERSLEADCNIFAKMMNDDKMIDEVSYQVYKTLYDATAADFALDAVFYLDVSPETCLERIGKRAREGESGISLDYLAKCDQYYNNWLKMKQKYAIHWVSETD